MASLGFRTLLTDGDNNPKTALSNGSQDDFYTMLMHFAHHKTSGFNVCVAASPGCSGGCLDEAGHGQMKMVQRVRLARTKYFQLHRKLFAKRLITEIDKLVRKCNKLGKTPALRLNGTSDIIWERVCPWLFTDYPQIQFYDYTKHVHRCMASYQKKLPTNYHLTFSRHELNDAECRKVLRSGVCNVAVVFRDSSYPSKWAGKPTYSMDNDDLRFLDADGGHVGCLYAKGKKARQDTTGFVLNTLTAKGGV